jgi:peroxiredoxin
MKFVTLLLSFYASFAFASAKVDAPAPNFKVKDDMGVEHTLQEYKGKFVVLEWSNKDCPYVKKQYGSGNMQKLQKTYTDKGVVWLTVLSSKEGKQGHLTNEEAQKVAKENKSAATAILMDENSKVAKAYGAKTTPHMFIVNPEGKLVYNGAIDDNDSTDPKVIPTSKNYVAEALDAAMKGEKIANAVTTPYGCGVKY